MEWKLLNCDDFGMNYKEIFLQTKIWGQKSVKILFENLTLLKGFQKTKF